MSFIYETLTHAEPVKTKHSIKNQTHIFHLKFQLQTRKKIEYKIIKSLAD